jgi:thiosulfate/3-mercaptopyruvate sulfurtransferase
MLADTDWLAEHIDDPNIRIIDCDEFPEYRRSHIKNAVGIQVHHYIKHPDYPKDSHAYPWVAEPDVVKELMEKMGIGDDTLVVTYDANGSLSAARFWWVLNYYGHTNVKVLDGGWRRWVAEGRKISFDRARPAAAVKFTPKTDDSVMVKADELQAACNMDDAVLWDVRSDGEWDGSNNRGNKRAGHLPGAVHLEWFHLMDRETHRFKPADEIRNILNENGITPDKKVFSY